MIRFLLWLLCHVTVMNMIGVGQGLRGDEGGRYR